MADIGQALIGGMMGPSAAASNEFTSGTVGFNAISQPMNQATYNIAGETAAATLGNYEKTMAPALAQSQGLLASNAQNQAAVGDLTNLLGLGPQGTAGALAALEQTPGYQFQVQTGTDQLQRQMNAGGLAFSGNFAQGASQYLSGLASNTYNQQLQNYQNYLNQQGQLGQVNANLLQGNADLQAAMTQQVGASYAATDRASLNSVSGGVYSNKAASSLLGGY